MPSIRIDESREMDSASRRTFRKLTDSMNDTFNVSSNHGRRNLLDNGQFRINQRAATSLAMGAGAPGLADRSRQANGGAGTSVQGWTTFDSFGVLLPAGRPRPDHVQYVQMTAADAALAAGDFITGHSQNIEGLNLQHLMYGTKDAQPMVLTFDVYCNIATPMIVELINNDSTQRYISFVYNTVALKFTTITINIPADIAAGWKFDNDSNASLSVNWFLCGGSTFSSGVAGTPWGPQVGINRMAGVNNAFPATNGNIWAVTNTQLEVGTVATPYEVRSFEDELRTCMRYYETSYNYGLAPGSSTTTGTARAQAFDAAVLNRLVVTDGSYSVRKRATPTILTWGYSGTASVVETYNAPGVTIGIAGLTVAGERTMSGANLTLAANAVMASYYMFHWSASSEI